MLKDECDFTLTRLNSSHGMQEINADQQDGRVQTTSY